MEDRNLAAVLYLTKHGIPYDRAAAMDGRALDRHVELLAAMNGERRNWRQDQFAIRVPMPHDAGVGGLRMTSSMSASGILHETETAA